MIDSDLDNLLARGRLSGAERERVLANVLDQTSPRFSARSRAARSGAIALGGLAAAAALALFVHGKSNIIKGDRADGSFAARGAATDGVRVEAACTGGPLAACPSGSRLVFHGWPSAQPAYLAAFADPVGGGERIWYFSAEGQSPRLGDGAVDREVVIGAEHVAARYLVHVVVGVRPLSRGEALVAKGPAILDAETIDLGVVR